MVGLPGTMGDVLRADMIQGTMELGRGRERGREGGKEYGELLWG